MDLIKENNCFFIRYQPYSHADTLSLISIGNSLISFDEVIKKAFRLSKIEGDIESSIIHAKDGSIILDIGVNLILALGSNGFSDIQQCLNFLIMSNYEEYQRISGNVEVFSDTYNSLETFFKDHPIAFQLTVLFIGYLMHYIQIGGVISENSDISNQTIISQNIIKINQNLFVTRDQLEQIKQDKKKKTFNELVSPIIQDDAEKIEFGTYSITGERQIIHSIDSGNFENYISDGVQILPQYENGKLYRFQGRIVSMQVARGETIGFRAIIDEKSYQLLSKVGEQHSVDEYKGLFNQEVYIEAIIERGSLYKKPILLIQKIQLVNQPLPLDVR